jgi:hypothetical protein
MKNIPTLIGGGERDEVILQTAFAAALPCASHLDCLRVHVSAPEAARGGPCRVRGRPALRDALSRLEANAATYSRLAADNIRDFCDRAVIGISDAIVDRRNGVTASYREETDRALERLLAYGHCSDLIVMGRAKQTQGLPSYTLEHLAARCERPMLVAASAAPEKLTGTVIVCWDGSKAAGRAIEAALPILARARQVVVVSVARSRARRQDRGQGHAQADRARDRGAGEAHPGRRPRRCGSALGGRRLRRRSRRDGRLWPLDRTRASVRQPHRGHRPAHRSADPDDALKCCLSFRLS